MANEPVISFVRRMKTRLTAPIGRRPISEATNGAAAPEPRRAPMKVGRAGSGTQRVRAPAAG